MVANYTSDNANYTSASSSAVSFTIGQATPTVSVTDAGGTYNTDPFPATGATVTGVGTDGTIASFGDPSLSYSYYSGTTLLAGAPTAAGAYTVVANYTSDNANYTSASSSAVSFTIGQATPTVSVTDAGGTYNTDPFPATGATVTGVGTDGTIASFGDPSLSYSFGDSSLIVSYYSGTTLLAGAPTAAGAYTVVAHYASDNPNYTDADSSPLSFTIAQAAPTVSVTDAGGTYSTDPYPATDASVTGVGTDGKLASFGDPTLSYSYFSGATLLAGAPTAAGAYTVVAHYASDNPNYTDADSSPLSFTIAQAAPTVSVTDAGGTYNTDPFPATGATVTGVGTDGTIASFGDPSLSYSYYSGTTLLAGAPTAAGAYTVVANYTSDNANYTSASSSAVSFTIGQATPTVSVTDAGGTYSTDPFPATGATVTGVGTDGTIASFGDPSLSYSYYSGTTLLAGAPTAAGAYTVVANYTSDNANYTSASSSAVSFTIGQATPTVSVTDAGGTYNTDPFPATGVTVTGVGTDGTIASFGDPSLSYSYYSGTTLLAGAPTAAGAYTVVANYTSDNANYTSASSSAVSFTIGQATPTVSVTDAGGTPSTDPFPATGATVTGVGTDGTIASFGDPSLSYSYYSGTTLLAGAPTAAGAYTVVANYTSDNANYTSASSSAVSFTIGQATPTVSVTDAGGTYSTDPFPATGATVTGVGTDGTIASFGDPSLSYSYYSGTTLLAGAPTAAGAYTVVANYTSDNANYTSASSSAVSFTIGQATPTVSVTDAGGTYNTDPFPATGATVTGVGTDGTIASFGDPSLSYSYYSGTTLLAGAPTAAGSYTVVANYTSNNPNYTNAHSSPLSFRVSQANTTTALTSGTNPSRSGQAVTFTATVAAISPGAGTPTGTVTFDDNGTPFADGTVTLSSGVATFSTSSLAVGTQSITAVYSGDTNFTTSTSNAVSQVVDQASRTTALALTSGTNPSTSGQPVTFTATVAVVSPGTGTPTGTVTFDDNGTQIGTGTLTAGVATFSTSSLAVGTQSITAVYSGDTNFTTSTSSAHSQVVNTPATLNQVLVDEDYRALLNRAAEPGGLTYWSTQLNNGATPNSVGMAIANSTESKTDIVTNDYQSFLNRAPEPGGLAYWLGQLQSGRTPDQVAAGILGSVEYFADNGSTNQGFVSALYRNVLGRTPDSGGNTFWLNALASGVSRTQVAFDFLTSPEAAAKQATSADYSGILNRSPDSAGLNFWVTALTGPSPSLTNQQVTVDFIDSAENINRIDTAIAQLPDATVDQIAMSLWSSRQG